MLNRELCCIESGEPSRLRPGCCHPGWSCSHSKSVHAHHPFGLRVSRLGRHRRLCIHQHSQGRGQFLLSFWRRRRRRVSGQQRKHIRRRVMPCCLFWRTSTPSGTVFLSWPALVTTWQRHCSCGCQPDLLVTVRQHGSSLPAPKCCSGACLQAARDWDGQWSHQWSIRRVWR